MSERKQIHMNSLFPDGVSKIYRFDAQYKTRISPSFVQQIISDCKDSKVCRAYFREYLKGSWLYEFRLDFEIPVVTVSETVEYSKEEFEAIIDKDCCISPLDGMGEVYLFHNMKDLEKKKKEDIEECEKYTSYISMKELLDLIDNLPPSN